MKMVLATGNAHKVREIRGFLPGDVELVIQTELDIPSPEETGLTFVENAIIKARNAAAFSGMPAIADDSGLAVDYLAGAPGIYSSRYAGIDATDADNNAKLLEALDGVPPEQRRARFHCIIVMLRHPGDPVPLIAQGSWEGEIMSAPRGRNGFGYDPLFYVPSMNCSAAELPAEKKNQLSHRGQALRQLQELMRQ